MAYGIVALDGLNRRKLFLAATRFIADPKEFPAPLSHDRLLFSPANLRVFCSRRIGGVGFNMLQFETSDDHLQSILANRDKLARYTSALPTNPNVGFQDRSDGDYRSSIFVSTATKPLYDRTDFEGLKHTCCLIRGVNGGLNISQLLSRFSDAPVSIAQIDSFKAPGDGYGYDHCIFLRLHVFIDENPYQSISFFQREVTDAVAELYGRQATVKFTEYDSSQDLRLAGLLPLPEGAYAELRPLDNHAPEEEGWVYFSYALPDSPGLTSRLLEALQAILGGSIDTPRSVLHRCCMRAFGGRACGVIAIHDEDKLLDTESVERDLSRASESRLWSSVGYANSNANKSWEQKVGVSSVAV